MESSGSQDKHPVPKFSSFKPPPAPEEAERRPRTERRHENRSRSPQRYTHAPRRYSPTRRPRPTHSRADYSLRDRHERRSRSPRRHIDADRRRSPSRRPQPTRDTRADYPFRDRLTSSEHEINRDRKPRRDTSFDENQPQLPIAEDGANDLSGLKDDQLFNVDRKGDHSVFKYGTVHRYSVPSYRRIGSGQVLGLPPNLVIGHEEPEKDIITLRDKNTASRKRKFSRPLSGPVKQTTQIYRLQQDANALSVDELNDDLILLGLSTGGRYGGADDSNDSTDSDDDRLGYRSIHGKAKIEDVVPQGMELISDPNSQYDARHVRIDEDRRARDAELWSSLNANPEDVAKWLELIDHQNDLILGYEDSRVLTSAERKKLAEIKLSLYDQALAKCSSNVQKDLLLLGRLREGGQLWDKDTLSDEWQKTLEKNPESTALQLKFIDLQQTDFQDFALQKHKSLLIECMRRVDAGPNASPRSQVQCYLLLRLTLLLREAGYTELAVGLWQAVLEFVFFRPDDHLEDTALQQFGDFWNSEVARLGEFGGAGWRSDNKFMPDPVTRELPVHVDVSSVFSSWASFERNCIQNFKMPARSVDDYGADVDIAYSVVLASDHREILPSYWPTPVSGDLVNAFLYFCHLPPLTRPSDSQSTRLWSGDPFLRNDAMGTAQPQLRDWLPPETDDLQFSISPFSFPVVDFLPTTNTLFAPENWFYSLRSWQNATLGNSLPLDTEWVRRTLKSLAGHFDQDDEFAEYVLAVEFACDQKAAAEFAKRMLKTRRASVKLYNTFALMQYRSGAQKTAFNAWSATIGHSGFSTLECGLLWSTWAWEMLEQGDFAKCSFLLYSIPKGEVDLTAFQDATDATEYSPLEELKLKRHLEEAAQQALANGHLHLYLAYTDCIALNRYTSHKSLDGALDAYVSATLSLRNLPPEQAKFKALVTEHLHQARGRIIYLHVSQKRQFQPRRLEVLLRESVSLFPHNTMFLALFMWNDSRFSMLDRVRDPMTLVRTQLRSRYELDAQTGVSPIIPQKTPVTIHLFSIYMALNRPTWAGGNVHYVRAAFERAVGEQSDLLRHSHGNGAVQSSGDDSACSNITVWMLYILFELDRAQDIKAAKAVFYRALRACPWSKELAMLGFERLGEEDVLDFDDLRGVYNILNEKELRLYVGIVEQMEEAAVKRAEAEAEADTDAEAEADAWLKSLGEEIGVGLV